jgi:hypothetical protein
MANAVEHEYNDWLARYRRAWIERAAAVLLGQVRGRRGHSPVLDPPARLP